MIARTTLDKSAIVVRALRTNFPITHHMKKYERTASGRAGGRFICLYIEALANIAIYICYAGFILPMCLK